MKRQEGGSEQGRRARGKKNRVTRVLLKKTLCGPHLSGTMSLRVVVQEPMKSWSPDL